MIRSPAGFDGGDRIKRYLDYYQPSYGVMMLSAGQFSPAQLFASGEIGAWYDPSDLTTMFQDSAGTTPVTAVEQPVGLVLDKSKGLVLGPELVTNGDFSNGTTGWSGSGGATLSVVSGALRITGTASGQWANTSITTVSGRGYAVTFMLATLSGTGSTDFFVGSTLGGVNNGVANYSSTGSKTFFFTASATTTYLAFNIKSAAGYIDIDNISARELPGNHLSQSTPTARPVLRATSRIDYDGTDDKMTAASSGGGTTGFLFVAGINLDAIGATQTIWSDTGTNTGYRVRINSSNQLELAAGNGTAYTTAVTTETLSATTNHVIAAWHDGTNLNVKLGTGGAVTSQAFAAASAGSAGFTIGMDNGSVSSQLNGKLYNVVYVKNFAGSLSDVTNTIAYVNGTLT